MNKPTKLLLAEDELALGQIVKESLETRGFSVIWVKNGEAAAEIFVQDTFDLLVLDVMMPKKDGFTLAQDIREKGQDIPIIFLTAKSQTKDVVEGFHRGGNDYLKKPFSVEELIVRIQNLLRLKSTRPSTSEHLKIGDFTFVPHKQSLRFKTEKKVQLTHREAQLLLHLYQKKNALLERQFILNKLWGNDDFFSARSMDVFISKLRKKLKKDSNVQIINVRGFGYKLVV